MSESEESDMLNCLRLLNDAHPEAIFCLVPDRLSDDCVWQVWRFDEGTMVSSSQTAMKAVLAAHRKLLESAE